MIEIINLRKKINGHLITEDVNLSIPKGEITCIIGGSGAGKSVLLKQIIGLIKPTSGHIIIDGTDITTAHKNERRSVFKQCGYVFQFAALLDSLTVFENVGLSLLDQGYSHKNVLTIVKEKLALVNLDDHILDKYPSELSGGMKKRVGIARTLVLNPSIIMYDEPTTGLDPITTRIVHDLMFSMQQKLGITSLVISHDIEIFKYVDNIALLHEGTIRYFGKAKDIWSCDNPYVYQFIRGLSEGPISTEVDIQK
jgi:phospholipid/cholesterol/gamma-HCH transport system ATP-binding protein